MLPGDERLAFNWRGGFALRRAESGGRFAELIKRLVSNGRRQARVRPQIKPLPEAAAVAPAQANNLALFNKWRRAK